MSVNVLTQEGLVQLATLGGGDGNANDVELTKAEYDALGSDKLTDGINYYITDWAQVSTGAEGGEGGASSAIKVSYDNSDSTLEAENVQDALDEVSSYMEEYVSLGKTVIADAITRKGVETSAGNTFQTMADNILNIGLNKAKVYVNSTKTNDINESFTLKEDGTLTVMAIMTYRSSYATLKRNGATIDPKTSFINSGSVMTARYWSFNCTKDDTISISSGSDGSASNNCYCIAINTIP